MRSGVQAPSPAGGIGAWIEFARLRQILGEWGLPLLILAGIAARPRPSWGTAWAATAWLAVVVFIHFLNDVEDAADDARTSRRPRNPLARGAIDPGAARVGTWLLGAASLAAVLSLSRAAVLPGLCIWVLGVLYSWSRVRLKGVPCADCVSHGAMAGATVLLFAGLDGSARDAGTWAIALGASVFSAGGGLHNQIRDRQADRRAGLRNTSAVLGVGRARRLKLGLYLAGMALAAVGVGYVMGVVPERLLP